MEHIYPDRKWFLISSSVYSREVSTLKKTKDRNYLEKYYLSHGFFSRFKKLVFRDRLWKYGSMLPNYLFYSNFPIMHLILFKVESRAEKDLSDTLIQGRLQKFTISEER
jgi:hypothetical protein